jgi:hypothetical protein
VCCLSKTALSFQGRAGVRLTLVDVARNVFSGSLKKLVPQNPCQPHGRDKRRAGVVGYVNGRPFSVLTLEIADGFVRNIYIVTNPRNLPGGQNCPRALLNSSTRSEFVTDDRSRRSSLTKA